MDCVGKAIIVETPLTHSSERYPRTLLKLRSMYPFEHNHGKMFLKCCLVFTSCVIKQTSREARWLMMSNVEWRACPLTGAERALSIYSGSSATG